MAFDSASKRFLSSIHFFFACDNVYLLHVATGLVSSHCTIRPRVFS